jgi:amidase
MSNIVDPSKGFMPYPNASVENAKVGPLSLLSFAVKDLFDVAGYPTSAGQPLWLAQSGIKTTTAPVVTSLLNAGAKFSGKTITDELAFSINGRNAHFGDPINGADPNRICGGSSSGSAAVVSHGLVDFALGTDTGGSIRVPASHCGLWGIRPTHGRVSLIATHDLAPSLDTCGWLAKNPNIFLQVGDVLLGQDTSSLSGALRVLEPVDVWGLLDQDVMLSLTPTRNNLHRALGTPEFFSLALESFDSMLMCFRQLQGYEAWQVNGEFIRNQNPPLGPGIKERFEWSSKVTLDQYHQALKFRALFRNHIDQVLKHNGILLLPTMPDIAPLRSAPESTLEDYRNKALSMLCIAGIAGLPQVNLPLANRLGSPLGLSLIGPRGSDRSLVALAISLSQV